MLSAWSRIFSAASPLNAGVPGRIAGLGLAAMSAALWAIGGIAGAQYTWFEAIDRSNVALATFVQYSAVPMTAGWQMLRRQVRPTVSLAVP